MEYEKNSNDNTDEKSPQRQAIVNFTAKPRSLKTRVTPSRFTELWPRGQSSPKLNTVQPRRLNFDV